MSKIIRITLFKIPSKENQEKMLNLYRTLSKTAVKDGKPYILTLSAGPAHADERSQGYTIVAKSEFSSLDDMRYYDNDCEAHKVLKAGAKGECGVEGVFIVYYTPSVEAGF